MPLIARFVMLQTELLFWRACHMRVVLQIWPKIGKSTTFDRFRMLAIRTRTLHKIKDSVRKQILASKDWTHVVVISINSNVIGMPFWARLSSTFWPDIQVLTKNTLMNDQTANRVANHAVVEVKAFYTTKGAIADLGIIIFFSRRWCFDVSVITYMFNRSKATR